MKITVEGYKKAEVEFQINYKGINVLTAETTKLRGKKRVTIFIHQKDDSISVKSVCGLTETKHEIYKIEN